MLQKYLKDKYGENYDQKAQEDFDSARSQNRWAQLGSDIGDAIGGQKVGSGDQYFQNLNKQAKENTLGKVEKDRDMYVKNSLDSANMKDASRKMALSDPNSQESNTYRKMIEAKFPDVVKVYGDDWNKVSAADQESIFRPLQLKEQVEARKEAARLSAGSQKEARDQREYDKQVKLKEKMQGLQTPFGLASTADDAKQLKEGYVSKNNFDKKLNELISLREKYGGEVMNREAVARGEQLSKDLLLEYKNMAKLGVLSQSDESIINAIIPADPLAFRSPLAAMQGQDPILSNLKKFKGDSDADYKNQIAARTRQGLKDIGGKGGAVGPKTVKVTNGQETLEIPIEDLADAKKDGFSEVSNMAGQ